MGDDKRLAAVVALAQGMAAAHGSREAWRAGQVSRLGAAG